VVIPVQMNVDRSVDVKDVYYKPVVSLSPNPFKESLNVNLFIPYTSPVKVQILNMHGMVVNTLINNVLAPGSYHVTWNGANSLNQTVASGVYFVTVLTNSGSTSLKAIKGN
jgi:flagellar hook assembly protein FlgD